ncbi:hypothetical protein O3P69_000402 [Scylla paramamosain]|uniref:Uncharacterized protein n=1 Tax=Scylla paramamosain TaxID=85552 RepID=A0AAW0UT83_SCYPA
MPTPSPFTTPTLHRSSQGTITRAAGGMGVRGYGCDHHDQEGIASRPGRPNKTRWQSAWPVCMATSSYTRCSCFSSSSCVPHHLGLLVHVDEQRPTAPSVGPHLCTLAYLAPLMKDTKQRYIKKFTFWAEESLAGL